MHLTVHIGTHFTPTLSNGITLHRLSSGGSGGSGSGLAVAVSMKPPIFSAAPLCILVSDVRIGVEGEPGAEVAQHTGQGLYIHAAGGAIVAKVCRRSWKRTCSSIPAFASSFRLILDTASGLQ